MSLFKRVAIGLGAYKPARWLVDHTIHRDRLKAHAKRRAILQPFIAAGDLCFDIGANIGDYTATLLSLGARVVVVDPQPSAVHELRARFSGQQSVAVEPVALGSKPGTADFFIRRHHGSSGLLEQWGEREALQKIQVPVTTLEHLIERHGRPRYIKIDVEGYEQRVISGLQSAVPLLSFEYSLHETDIRSKLALIADLARFGRPFLNLLPNDAAEFYFGQFVAVNDFLEVFPNGLPREAFLGDIFVRFKTHQDDFEDGHE